MKRKITMDNIRNFEAYLIREEKSRATVEKYGRDVRHFYQWLGTDRQIDKQRVVMYKEYLIRSYRVSSVNSMLAALNHFLLFMKWEVYRVKRLKVQKPIFRPEEQELSAAEYKQLLRAASAEGRERIYTVMLTLCSTGIRVSELPFITVEAVRNGKAEVCCKNKRRVILISSRMRQILLNYSKKMGVSQGSIFVTRSGKPVHRSWIWAQMKDLCETAGVSKQKVYPHNLRHLFALTFYQSEKDIVKLADILGHSSINTTRIYTLQTGREHIRQMERLGLVP